MGYNLSPSGVFSPLLDAINSSRTNKDTSVEILWGFADGFLESEKDGKLLGVDSSVLVSEISSAFNLWETLFNIVYRSNKIKTGNLNLSFSRDDSAKQFSIGAKPLPKGEFVLIQEREIFLNSSVDWKRLSALKGTDVYGVASYAIGKALGLSSTADLNSIMNSTLFASNYLIKFGLKEVEGVVLNPLAGAIGETSAVIHHAYGNVNFTYDIVYGCMDPAAENYNAEATRTNGTCTYTTEEISSSRLHYIGQREVPSEVMFNSLNYYTLTSNGPNTVTPTPVGTNFGSSARFSTLFQSDNLIKLYVGISPYGVVNAFNSQGSVVSETPYLPNYIELNDIYSIGVGMFEADNKIYYVNNGLRTHVFNPEAHQTSGGEIVYNCDALDSGGELGNYEQPESLGSTNIRVVGSIVGGFDADMDLSGGEPTNSVEYYDTLQYPVGDVEVYTSPIENRKIIFIPKYSAATLQGTPEMVPLVFDLYSSTYFKFPFNVGSAVRKMRNGETIDREFSYKNCRSFDTVTNAAIIYEGFTFDSESYGILSISNKKWSSDTSKFTTAVEEVMVDLNNPSDHIVKMSQLPIVAGHKLFAGDTQILSDVNTGGGGGSVYTSFPPEWTDIDEKSGYFKIAYAIEHGFILMHMHSYSPVILRPDTPDGVEIHIPGGDFLNNTDILNAGGFTPISLAFSPDCNFLYTIVVNPIDSTDRRLCVYNTTFTTAEGILASTQMIDNPFSGELSRIEEREGSIFIYSANSNEYCVINNPDLQDSVDTFINYPIINVLEEGIFEMFPTTINGPSGESTFASPVVDPGESVIANNHTLTDYIQTAIGRLNLNSPTLVPQTTEVDTIAHSTVISDTAGNFLMSIYSEDEASITYLNREGESTTLELSADLNNAQNSIFYVPLLNPTNGFLTCVVQGNDINARLLTFDSEKGSSLVSPSNLTLGTIGDPMALISYGEGTVHRGVGVISISTFSTWILQVVTVSAVVKVVAHNVNPVVFSEEKNNVEDTKVESIGIHTFNYPNSTADIGIVSNIDGSKIFIYSKTFDGDRRSTLADFNTNTGEVSNPISYPIFSLPVEYNIKEAVFSMQGNDIYLLLTHTSDGSSLLYRINTTLTGSSAISKVDDLVYVTNYDGGQMPSEVFTYTEEGIPHYLDETLKDRSSISSMYLGKDGRIYTILTNDGTVKPALGVILHSNSSTTSTPKYAHAGIVVSDTVGSLNTNRNFTDITTAKIPSPEEDDPIVGHVFGCLDTSACNHNSNANAHFFPMCEYPDTGCTCEAPYGYSLCPCTESPQPNIGGYEYCQKCEDDADFNPDLHISTPELCVYYECLESTACNTFDSSGIIGTVINDPSKCVMPIIGCECADNGTRTNILDVNGNPTHCGDCSDVSLTFDSLLLLQAGEYCDCDNNPYDGYCDCAGTTPEGTTCDCDGPINTSTGVTYCDCDGTLPTTYCGCGTDFLDGLAINTNPSDGLPGICDCDGTPKIPYYNDADGDGLGDPNTVAYYCEGDQPSGWVSNSNDTNIDCESDPSYFGYYNYSSGTPVFVPGDYDAVGECSGEMLIDYCGNVATSADATYNSNIHGDPCCDNMVIDCATGECVPFESSTQEASTSPGCDCGILKDECGTCGGDGPGECGCDNIPEGACNCAGQFVDDCNVCGGDNSTCTGCTDPLATNYDATALIDSGNCTYLTMSESIDLAMGTIENNSNLQATFETPFTVVSATPEPMNLNSLQVGYVITDEGLFQDIGKVTNKCQVISTDNPVLICSNPIHNAEILYTSTGLDGDIYASIVDSEEVAYNEVYTQDQANVIVYYYFRIDPSFELEISNIEEVFSSVADNITVIKNSTGDIYMPGVVNNIGNLESLTLGTIENAAEGELASIQLYDVYIVRASGEFTLDFSAFEVEGSPCDGIGLSEICCESEGVTNPGEFTEIDGNVVASNECEICSSGACIPENTNAQVPVCMDGTALNYFSGTYDPDVHINAPESCIYPNQTNITHLGIDLTINTDGMTQGVLDQIQWVIYSNTGGIVFETPQLYLEEAIGGTIATTFNIPLSSSCMWFLPLGFDKNDVWSKVDLKIVNAVGAVLGRLMSGHPTLSTGNPTNGSMKLDISGGCTLGCTNDFSTLQTEYCTKDVKKDASEFTDFILEVVTAEGADNEYSNTKIDVIDIATGNVIVSLEALSTNTTYGKVFRLNTNAKVGVRVKNPGNSPLTYSVSSEYGEVITKKKVL